MDKDSLISPKMNTPDKGIGETPSWQTSVLPGDIGEYCQLSAF